MLVEWATAAPPGCVLVEEGGPDGITVVVGGGRRQRASVRCGRLTLVSFRLLRVVSSDNACVCADPRCRSVGEGCHCCTAHCLHCTANKLLSCLRAGGDAGVQFCSADGHPGDSGAESEGEGEAVEVCTAVMWCCWQEGDVAADGAVSVLISRSAVVHLRLQCSRCNA